MAFEYELNIWDYIRILRKRYRIILLSFFLFLLLGYINIKSTPSVYEAKAVIKIETAPSWDYLAGFSWKGPEIIPTEIMNIKSARVLEEVAKKLGYLNQNSPEKKKSKILSYLKSSIKVKQIPSTSLIEITSTSSNPQESVKLVNTICEVYKEFNRRDKSRQILSTYEFVKRQVSKYEKEITKYEKELEEFRRRNPTASIGEELSLNVAASMGSSEVIKKRLVELHMKLFSLLQKYTEIHPEVIKIRREINFLEKQLFAPEKTRKLSELIRNLNISRDLYEMFRKRLEEIKIALSQQTGDVIIVDPAIIPLHPVSPHPGRIFTLSGIMGLVMGVILAFIAESLDTSIGTIEEVEEFVKLPVLALIPYIKGNSVKDILKKGNNLSKQELEYYSRLLFVIPRNSPEAESFYTLITSLQHFCLRKNKKVIMFTSVSGKEGKSLICVNTALAASSIGKKTLLIDGDLRTPILHRLLGVPRYKGLFELIIEDVDKKEIIKDLDDLFLGEIKSNILTQFTGLENLHFISSGHLRLNPVELFQIPKFSHLLTEFRREYDIIIIDTPPLLSVADASILSPLVDTSIIIYKVGKVARAALKRGKSIIESSHGNVSGVVLNALKASDLKFAQPYYKYYYQRYYLSERS